MDNENVVQMPTLLERLATKLKTCLTQEASNRQEWIAIQEAKCATLVEIRDQFSWNTAFGKWCADNGFGGDVLNNDTRAAAIAMGRNPDALRKCLEATERNSLDMIYRWEFPRLRSAPKTNNSRKKPKIDAARDAVRPLVAESKPIEGLIDQLGVSRTTIQLAAALEQGRLEGLAEQPPLDPADMPKTMRARYEAALCKARRELREEITAEVCAVYQDMVTWNRERVARADRIIASHQGVMSRDTFRRIKACLHPDHNTFTFAAEALQAFSELEKVLVKPDEIAPAASGLPKTAAEMMARRRR